jgi:hypothetical protein
MNINLPEALRLWAEQQAARTGWDGAEAYVAELLRRDRALNESLGPLGLLRQAMAEEGEDPASIPQERVEQRKQEIDARLEQALASGPAVPVTAEFWEERQRVLAERLHQGNKAGPV